MRPSPPTIGLLAAALIQSAPVEAQRVAPSDECGAVPGFDRFRSDLRRTVARKDAAALMAAVDQGVRTDFGGGGGRAEFKRSWLLSQPAASPVWPVLEDLLRLGCAPHQANLVMPRMFVRLPAGLDPDQHVVATRPTAVRTAPRPGARAIARVSDHVMRIRMAPRAPGWTAVSLRNRKGWVRSADVRRPLDHRALFHRIDGRWRIAALVKGD